MGLIVILAINSGFGNKVLRKNFLSAEKKVQKSTQI
jgi:hypothetical protein